ncbi:carbamoyltransferase [Mesorhizobium shonense]|uniref:Carbamoyltransferase n=1 Tax=Mesorhizobium shonense TaxID=1209948 RepID=A0ABV2I3W9_9HYPH
MRICGIKLTHDGPVGLVEDGQLVFCIEQEKREDNNRRGLEDRAPEIFSPGTPDPYMLFEHQTRAEWRDKVPAVVHLDGFVRLQTISRTSEHKVAELLIEYEKLTGIPLVCNTSANHHGRGSFQGAAAACRWGRIEHIWSDGVLLTEIPETELSPVDGALPLV